MYRLYLPIGANITRNIHTTRIYTAVDSLSITFIEKYEYGAVIHARSWTRNVNKLTRWSSFAKFPTTARCLAPSPRRVNLRKPITAPQYFIEERTKKKIAAHLITRCNIERTFSRCLLIIPT